MADNLKLWPSPLDLGEAAFTASIVSNALSIGMAIQLNTEVYTMILTLKANHEEKKEAAAKARAETEAKFRTWYEAHKDNLQDAPPPPFSGNGSNGAGPY